MRILQIISRKISYSIQRVRRSIIYVPAIDEKKLANMHNIRRADTVIIDLEDSVLPTKKAEARKNALDFFHNIPSTNKKEIGIRINSKSSNICEEDISVIFSNSTPNIILYPKVETYNDISWLEDQLKLNNVKTIIPLIAMVESPLAILNLRDIIEKCLSSNYILKLVGLMFGSDDYLVSLDAPRDPTCNNLLLARQSLVMHAKAYGLGAIDMVNIDFHDPIKLEKDAQLSRLLGFTGKQVIHPNQIPIVNTCYSPTKEQLAWARNLIDMFERTQLDNYGVITIQGKMIDRPVIEQARQILQFDNKINQNQDIEKS